MTLVATAVNLKANSVCRSVDLCVRLNRVYLKLLNILGRGLGGSLIPNLLSNFLLEFGHFLEGGGPKSKKI